MKTVKYYQVSNLQLFMMAITTGVIAAALITINIMAKEYLLLPVVVTDRDSKCASVVNYRNGDAYTCADVGIILRTYRTKVE
jgi:hypothetical protein